MKLAHREVPIGPRQFIFQVAVIGRFPAFIPVSNEAACQLVHCLLRKSAHTSCMSRATLQIWEQIPTLPAVSRKERRTWPIPESLPEVGDISDEKMIESACRVVLMRDAAARSPRP
ncbi:MAG: hypothetical protein ABIZ56_11545 [Chthoniobacteraceae bacterium]